MPFNIDMVDVLPFDKQPMMMIARFHLLHQPQPRIHAYTLLRIQTTHTISTIPIHVRFYDYSLPLDRPHTV